MEPWGSGWKGGTYILKIIRPWVPLDETTFELCQRCYKEIIQRIGLEPDGKRWSKE